MGDASILQRLRAADLRPTVARIGILQVIEASGPDCVSAEDVFRRMILRGTRVSLGTVYRTIQQLHLKTVLLREWDDFRKATYRLKPPGHESQAHRIVCRHCDHSIAFTDERLQARLKSIAEAQGIVLSGQALTVHVDCAGCCRHGVRAPSNRARQPRTAPQTPGKSPHRNGSMARVA